MQGTNKPAQHIAYIHVSDEFIKYVRHAKFVSCTNFLDAMCRYCVNETSAVVVVRENSLSILLMCTHVQHRSV